MLNICNTTVAPNAHGFSVHNPRASARHTSPMMAETMKPATAHGMRVTIKRSTRASTTSSTPCMQSSRAIRVIPGGRLRVGEIFVSSVYAASLFFTPF